VIVVSNVKENQLYGLSADFVFVDEATKKTVNYIKESEISIKKSLGVPVNVFRGQSNER
jgi:hypothetical protein